MRNYVWDEILPVHPKAVPNAATTVRMSRKRCEKSKVEILTIAREPLLDIMKFVGNCLFM